ncbi:MAG: hypothetical protein U0V02_10310 [Anaerolineales bacterium]
MKESVSNDKFSVKLLDTHNLFVAKTSEFSQMRIQSEPLFGGEAALFLMVFLAGLMGLLAGAFDKEDLTGVGAYIVILVLLLVAASTLRKRKLITTLNAVSKATVLDKGGVFGTGLLASKKGFAQTEIKQLVVERFAKGYFGGYGVKVITPTGDKVFITNQNLEFDDAKKCAESVREFLNLEEKVVVTG